jgi:hypothetical protein
MGTTTIRRSNNFNFEYSIVTSHSFPQDERTKSGVPFAGASSVAGKKPVRVQVLVGAVNGDAR